MRLKRTLKLTKAIFIYIAEVGRSLGWPLIPESSPALLWLFLFEKPYERGDTL